MDLLHAANLATWDPRLYFASGGRRAEDFPALKNPTALAGFEPANWGTRGHLIPAFNTGIQISILRTIIVSLS
jgi:hypothetical protein